jgi:hypothetical protein
MLRLLWSWLLGLAASIQRGLVLSHWNPLATVFGDLIRIDRCYFLDGGRNETAVLTLLANGERNSGLPGQNQERETLLDIQLHLLGIVVEIADREILPDG